MVSIPFADNVSLALLAKPVGPYLKGCNPGDCVALPSGGKCLELGKVASSGGSETDFHRWADPAGVACSLLATADGFLRCLTKDELGGGLVAGDEGSQCVD